MKLELSTRTAELQASELRLENMEKDLVEISLSNENYRSQVRLFYKSFKIQLQISGSIVLSLFKKNLKDHRFDCFTSLSNKSIDRSQDILKSLYLTNTVNRFFLQYLHQMFSYLSSQNFVTTVLYYNFNNDQD
jgi:hypothetical protein